MTRATRLPASELLSRVANVRELEAYYVARRDEVYRMCLRYGAGKRGWAEDATHDVFVKLIEHAHNLDHEEDLGGWLYRVTANVCLSRLRREQSAFTIAKRFFTGSEPRTSSLDEAFDEKSAAHAALETLGTLPARERTVACMRIFDGKSQREIANILGLSEAYVSRLLARAWTAIRRAGWEVGDEP